MQINLSFTLPPTPQPPPLWQGLPRPHSHLVCIFLLDPTAVKCSLPFPKTKGPPKAETGSVWKLKDNSKSPTKNKHCVWGVVGRRQGNNYPKRTEIDLLKVSQTVTASWEATEKCKSRGTKTV